MTRKNIVILGATCELGKELSVIYAKKNYNLILISRNLIKNLELADAIRNRFPDTFIEIYELDILNLEEQIKVYTKLKKNYRWCNFINW